MHKHVKIAGPSTITPFFMVPLVVRDYPNLGDLWGPGVFFTRRTALRLGGFMCRVSR